MDTVSHEHPTQDHARAAPTTPVARAVRRALRPRVRWSEIHPIAATRFTPREEARALRCALADIRRNNPDRALDAYGIFDLACFIGAEIFSDHRFDGTEADLFVLAVRAAMRHEDEVNEREAPP